MSTVENGRPVCEDSTLHFPRPICRRGSPSRPVKPGQRGDLSLLDSRPSPLPRAHSRKTPYFPPPCRVEASAKTDPKPLDRNILPAIPTCSNPFGEIHTPGGTGSASPDMNLELPLPSTAPFVIREFVIPIFPLLPACRRVPSTLPERRVCGCSFRLRKEVNEQPNPQPLLPLQRWSLGNGASRANPARKPPSVQLVS